MGCYVDEKGNQKDACVISRDYNKADHYYIFNHVDITITYHSGKAEDWGKYFTAEEIGKSNLSLNKKKLHTFKNWVLIKNPDYFSNPYETW